jgi:hypothetical protein
MIDRQSVFEAWKNLGAEVQALGAIVQNPTQNLTLDDRRQWEYAVMDVENRLNRLKANTQCLLSNTKDASR